MISEVFRKPMRIECEDGKMRTVHVKCYRFDGSFAADTFFSVPASTRGKRGAYVHGFITSDDDKLQFRAHNVCKARL
jgi:hypothetical protein